MSQVGICSLLLRSIQQDVPVTRLVEFVLFPDFFIYTERGRFAIIRSESQDALFHPETLTSILQILSLPFP